jgi:undecaprenyl-diphosphatase
VFIWLSRIGQLGLVWILIGAIVWAWRRDPAPLLLTIVCIAVADLLSTALKLLTGRARPFVANADQDPLVHTRLDVSFPSGHAAMSFAAATVLAGFVPRRLAPLLFVLAALIAWSRVYVGVHYPTDVIAGALLGTAVGLTVPRLLAAGRRRSRPARPGG